MGLDYATGRLYWSDLKRGTIETVRAANGKSRHLVKKFHTAKEGKPNQIEVFEDLIYFTTYQHFKV